MNYIIIIHKFQDNTKKDYIFLSFTIENYLFIKFCNILVI